MNSLNSILLEGNLVKDPEFSYTSKGTAMCKFSIAANRFYKVDGEYEEEVSFFDVTAWATQAEICNQYLKKGREIRIVGRLKQDRWKGSDGEDKAAVHIIADHVEFRPNFNEETEEKSENDNSKVNHNKQT